MGRTRSIIAKPEAVVGLDVGKFSHWAYGIGAAGEVTADFPVENREGALDSFFASVEPGTLVVVTLSVNATIDVCTLLVYGGENAARVAVKLVLGLRVANLLDGVAGNGLQVDIHFTAHLAHNHHLSCGDKGLAGHASRRIVGQKLVQYCVANLVGHFVGVTLRH